MPENRHNRGQFRRPIFRPLRQFPEMLYALWRKPQITRRFRSPRFPEGPCIQYQNHPPLPCNGNHQLPHTFPACFAERSRIPADLSMHLFQAVFRTTVVPHRVFKPPFHAKRRTVQMAIGHLPVPPPGRMDALNVMDRKGYPRHAFKILHRFRKSRCKWKRVCFHISNILCRPPLVKPRNIRKNMQKNRKKVGKTFKNIYILPVKFCF